VRAQLLRRLAAMLLLWSIGTHAQAPVAAGSHDGAPVDATDPCAGSPRDRISRPVAPLSIPPKGQPFTEPGFPSRIVRITDVARDFRAKVAVPLYSTIPAWNANESLMLLYVTSPGRGHMLYDGRTYKYLRTLDIAPADVEQVYWDPKDPDILWYIYNWEQSGQSIRELIRYHVAQGRKEVVHRFEGCGLPYGDQVGGGGDPQYNSWDNGLWGLRCRRKDPLGDVFTLRLPSGSESKRVTVRNVTPVACPSGKCLWAPTDGGSVLLDPDRLSLVRRLSLNGIEHGDLGLSATGEDFFATAQYEGDHVGSVVVEFLESGRIEPLVAPGTGYPYPPSGTHISAVAFARPGWIAASITGNPRGGLLDSELLLANVDTGTVCRLGHHRSAGSDGPAGYWAEPHVTISPSATRVLFASDWEGTGIVDSYVLETPAYHEAR
jgi:hypothetical protein